MSLAIETDHLTKLFARPRHVAGFTLPFASQEGTLAVDHVSFTVHQGEIFGLVGPNGAGKTTLVKLLCTLILPTSGTARVNGFDLAQESRIKASIGLVTGDERSFYWRLSCRENLRFYAGLLGLPAAQAERRIAELSRRLDLGDFLDKRFDACSTGMKHRLALARGLLNDPAVLFLDEPTRSLDPLAAIRFREMVYTLSRQEGHTIFLVTHDLEEAAELCDRAAVMFQGRLRLSDAPARLQLLIRGEGTCHLQARGLAPHTIARLRCLEGGADLVTRDAPDGATAIELRLPERRRDLTAVVREIEADGGVVEGLEFAQTSWQEVFDRLGEQRTVASQPAVPPTAEPVAPTPTAAATRQRHGDLAPPSPLRALFRKPLLFFRRDFLVQVSYRLSFILQLLGILFSVTTFYFVARLLGAAATPYLGDYGGDYFPFVLVGIAFVGYQGVALYTFSGIVQSAQVMGTLEAMLVTPTRLSTILFSSSLWDFAFSSLNVMAYMLAGVILFGVDLRGADLFAALVILCLTILTLSSIGILSASFIMVFKRGSPINFVFGSLSVLLGGVYYPLAVLPPWLQAIARLLPLTYSLDAMRRALLLGESLVELLPEVTALAGFSALLLPLSLLAFRYAVRQAKKDGSLAQF